MNDTHRHKDSKGPVGENEVIHEVDGIQEYDNHLPNWWLYTLYGAIVFSVFYWFHFHVFENGESLTRTYRREMAALAERQGKSVPVTSDALADMAKDPTVVGEGGSIFAANCVSCHGPAGGGGIGPNLTDNFWIHGGGGEEIYKSVKEGYPTKGMLAWGQQLGDKRVQAVSAYVLTLRGTNVAGGKAPQGDPWPAK